MRVEELKEPYGYKEFKVEDLYKVESGKHIAKKDLVEGSEVPVYSSQSTNGGIVGYTNIRPRYEISKEKPFYVIFGDHTQEFNIADKSFNSMNTVKVLNPPNYNREVNLYMFTHIQKAVPNQGYARHWTPTKNALINLPIKEDGSVDYEYMEQYIHNQTYKHLQNLDSYVNHEIDLMKQIIGEEYFEDDDLIGGLEPATNRKEFKVSDEPYGYREFKVEELFNVIPTKWYKNMKDDEIISDEGTVPFITTTSYNTGVKGYSKLEPNNEGNVITYSDTTTSDAVFYREYPYIGRSHVQKMIPKERFNREIAMYIISSIRKSSEGLYDYSNKFNRDAMNNTHITLPIKEDGEVDYQYIERYVSYKTAHKLNSLKEYLESEIG